MRWASQTALGSRFAELGAESFLPHGGSFKALEALGASLGLGRRPAATTSTALNSKLSTLSLKPGLNPEHEEHTAIASALT